MILEVFDLQDPTYARKLVLSIHPHKATEADIITLQELYKLNEVYGGRKFEFKQRPFTPQEEVLYGQVQRRG